MIGFGDVSKLLDIGRGVIAGWRVANEDKDWMLPAPQDIAEMSDAERTILILLGIRELGIRQAQNEGFTAILKSLDDMSGLLRQWISGAQRTCDGGMYFPPPGGAGMPPVAQDGLGAGPWYVQGNQPIKDPEGRDVAPISSTDLYHTAANWGGQGPPARFVANEAQVLRTKIDGRGLVYVLLVWKDGQGWYPVTRAP